MRNITFLNKTRGTSSVTFWTLFGGANSAVVIWLACGESATSLVANTMSLIQEPGSDNPRFTPFYFFMANAIILFISLIALIYLNTQPGNPEPQRVSNGKIHNLKMGGARKDFANFEILVNTSQMSSIQKILWPFENFWLFFQTFRMKYLVPFWKIQSFKQKSGLLFIKFCLFAKFFVFIR